MGGWSGGVSNISIMSNGVVLAGPDQNCTSIKMAHTVQHIPWRMQTISLTSYNIQGGSPAAVSLIRDRRLVRWYGCRSAGYSTNLR